MVARGRSYSCAQHQCFNDYLHLLVFTGCEFTINTDKYFSFVRSLEKLLQVISAHSPMPYYKCFICM